MPLLKAKILAVVPAGAAARGLLRSVIRIAAARGHRHSAGALDVSHDGRRRPPSLAPSSSPTASASWDTSGTCQDEIGPRPAGTPKELQTVDYIAGQLQSFGYDVSIQEFAVGSEAGRESTVNVTAPSPRTVTSLPFSQSGAGKAAGTIVPSGLGTTSEFPPAVAGNIALVQRGELLFQQKVANAVAAGAKGVIIYNNVAGSYLGSLSQPVAIPVVSISQADGEALAVESAGGRVSAEIAVGLVGNATGRNVIARPPGKECETITGGHFDSVPQAPGASDNATGTATTLEIAAIVASTGQMSSNCFVLFGAEENGLIGSRFYVNSLTPEQKNRLKAVINLDMVGVGDSFWGIIGSANLQSQTITVAASLGIEVQRYALAGASSDHASFINAGVPAVMIHRLNDGLLHTPQDVSSRVRPDLLEQAAKLGLGLIQSFAAGGG